jgi:hypothetical protein
MSEEHDTPRPMQWWQVFVIALLVLIVVALAALIMLSQSPG